MPLNIPAPGLGIVHPEVLYALTELQRRTGWSAHAMRTARRRGLRVLRSAGRAYVRGADFIAYIELQNQVAAAESQPQND